MLVVGQVPPPYHGQAIMVETLLRGRYESAELIHVEAAYSTSLDQIGRVSVDKVRRMLSVVWRTLRARRSTGAEVLYYHPAGANRSAVIRDIVVLTLLRPFFRFTVFHHHARGLLPAIDTLPPPFAALARRTFRAPDFAIAPSRALLDEAEQLEPVRSAVVANGTCGGEPSTPRSSRTAPRVLFLNLVSEEKGAHWLLSAVAELHRGGVPVRAVFAGEFPSDEDRLTFVDRIAELDLTGHVELPGLVTGDQKWATFADADVFCVPTTYAQESFGLALVEAASCGLVIVATDVPGVREVFRNGESALLADPDEPSTLADLLASVCSDDSRRVELGRRARALFEERYTEERFWSAMDAVFAEVAEALETGTATAGRPLRRWRLAR